MTCNPAHSPVLPQSALNLLHLGLLHSLVVRASLASGPVQMGATVVAPRLDARLSALFLPTSHHTSCHKLTFRYSSVQLTAGFHIQGRLLWTQTGERSGAKLSQFQVGPVQAAALKHLPVSNKNVFAIGQIRMLYLQTPQDRPRKNTLHLPHAFDTLLEYTKKYAKQQ